MQSSSTAGRATDAQAEQVLIVELDIPTDQQILLQSILQGEDGLSVIRSFGEAPGRQQFWTTPCQRQVALDWLASLPDQSA